MHWNLNEGFAVYLIHSTSPDSKGRKSAEQDLGQDLVGGIKDCDVSKNRAIQPVTLFVDWVNDTQFSLLR